MTGVQTCALPICVQDVSGQRVAIKSNALQWLTASPNIGAEFTLSRRFTMDLSIATNPSSLSSYDDWGIRFQPDIRYWFHRPMTKLFVGACGVYGEDHFLYAKKNTYSYYAGGGLLCGYAWILNSRWNMEVFGGVGVVYFKRTKNQPDDQGLIDVETRITPAPIKLGFSFSYILR